MIMDKNNNDNEQQKRVKQLNQEIMMIFEKRVPHLLAMLPLHY